MKRKPWPLVIEERHIIRGAGGIVSRFEGTALKILFIHRSKHNDWSFPKGRLNSGEPAWQAAIREVKEETACQCALGEELPTVRYIDRNKRPKEVRFWKMTVLSEETFIPNEEIAKISWLSLKEGFDVLTYNTDRILLKKAFANRRNEFFTSNPGPQLIQEMGTFLPQHNTKEET